MKCFGITDKGCIREENQDSFIVEKCDNGNCYILALCDGMGGANAGDIASQLSAKAFVSYLYNRLSVSAGRNSDLPWLMQAACEEANGVSFAYSQFGDDLSGMGTTLVGAVIRFNGKGYVINVGDSRAYYYSRRSRLLTQISHDHSLVEELLEFGAITKEQAEHHPQKNVITRALGSEEDIESDVFSVELGIGDVMIFCSDGLSNIVTDEEIAQLCLEEKQEDLLCRALVDLALQRNAPDNVTVVVLKR